MGNGQILSILSHVVHGYVGNRAITFPLQYLGWNVDALNTTNLSNHPGYGQFSGAVEPVETIEKVLDGLKAINNSMSLYDMVLTGYLPNAKVLQSVKKAIFEQFGQHSTNPKYIMDPILGDNGKLYVEEAIIPIYKEILSSGYVSVITPNQFEFEVLTDVKITDIESLKQAIQSFNTQFNVSDIVISSINLAAGMYSVGYNKDQNQLFMVPINEIPCKFFGCGDLFTALVSHNYWCQGKITPQGLKDSVMKLTAVLEYTYETEKKKRSDIKVINDINIIHLAQILEKDFGSDKEIEYIA